MEFEELFCILCSSTSTSDCDGRNGDGSHRDGSHSDDERSLAWSPKRIAAVHTLRHAPNASTTSTSVQLTCYPTFHKPLLP
jgi:hypothetical protein